MSGCVGVSDHVLVQYTDRNVNCISKHMRMLDVIIVIVRKEALCNMSVLNALTFSVISNTTGLISH